MPHVMGIDSGTRRAGIAVIDTDDKKRELIYIKHIRLDLVPYSRMELPERTHQLFEIVRDLIKLHKPHIVCIEKIRVNMGGRNMDAMLAAVRAQEAASIAAHECGIKPVEVMAVQARSKLAIKGKKRDIVKQEVLQMVNKLFKADLAKLGHPDGLADSEDDVSDAVALAMVGHLF